MFIGQAAWPGRWAADLRVLCLVIGPEWTRCWQDEEPMV